ncbi:manganese and iron superoxide dismutase, partial [Calocera viscosa TUFC12733]
AGARRELHELRPLRYPTDEPLGNFMSAAQLRIVAVEYQQGLLDRLNDEIKGAAGTEWESKGIVETVIETAANREHSLIFNYASQVLNNSFFLDSLVPQTQPNWNMIDHEFAADIEQNFGSVTQFMSYMSAAAMGMSGSGWVWLVVDAQNRLATVATYGSGTMLIRARQQVNPSTVKGDPLLFGGAAAGELTQRGPVPEGATGELSFSPTATVKAENFRFFGQDLNPIMCISVHEHAWLHDYGVWGKEEYLKRFWAVVDWNKV